MVLISVTFGYFHFIFIQFVIQIIIKRHIVRTCFKQRQNLMPSILAGFIKRCLPGILNSLANCLKIFIGSWEPPNSNLQKYLLLYTHADTLVPGNWIP